MHNNTSHLYYYKLQYIKEKCIFIKICVCIHTQKYIYTRIYTYIPIESGSSGISVLVYIGIICLKVYAYFFFSCSSINDFWIVNKTNKYTYTFICIYPRMCTYLLTSVQAYLLYYSVLLLGG